MAEKVGDLYYEVSADTAKLLTGSQQATKILDGLDKSSSKTDKAFTKLTKTSASVSAALAMPEVDRLTKQMAELAGKIGVSSETMKSNTVAAKQQWQALSTVSQLLGTSYIGSVGRSTSELLKQTVAAISSADANKKAADSALEEARALQSTSAALVEKAEAERRSASASVQAAEEALHAEELRYDQIQATSQATLEQLQAELAAAEAIGDRATAEVLQTHISSQKTRITQQEAAVNAALDASEAKVTAAKKAEALATQQLSQATAAETAAKRTLAAANETVAIAQNKATLAAKAQTAAMAGLRSVYMLLGGPSGILLLAAAGVYALYKAFSSNSSIDNYRDKIKDAIANLEQLTQAQAKVAAREAKIVLETDTKSLEEARKKVEFFRRQIELIESTPVQVYVDEDGFEQISDLTSSLPQLRKNLEDAEEKFDTLSSAVNESSDNLKSLNDRVIESENGEVFKKEQVALLKSASNEIRNARDQLSVFNVEQTEGARAAVEEAASLEALALKIDTSTTAYKKFINEKLAAFDTKKQLEYEKQTSSVANEINILKEQLQNGAKAAAQLRAELSLGVGATPEQIAAVRAQAAEYFDIQEKLNNSKKSGSSATKSYENAIKQLADQLLAAEHALTATNREQAIFEAQMRLGANATKAQKDAAAELAGQLYDLKQRQDDINNAKQADPTNAYKEGTAQLKRQLDNNLITQEQYNQRSQKLEVEHQKALAQIRAQEAVTPQQELAGMVDPVQALANENAKKLALIKEFEEDKMRVIELSNAANREYEQQRRDAMWELWRQQSILNETLAAAFDSVGSSASNALTGMLSGTKTVNEALLSVANTILNSVINSFVQMGIEQAKSAIMGATVQKSAIASTTIAQSAALVKTTAANTAAATTSTTAWTPAAIVASIGSFGGAAAIGLGAVVAALAGKRKNGGPVSAGSMYQVGEGGLPEIFQANNGRQYMIPGDNGSVISNKDIGSGGGVGVTVYNNIQNYTSSIVDSQVTSNSDGSVTIQTVVADLNQGGPISQAISYNHNAPRRATA